MSKELELEELKQLVSTNALADMGLNLGAALKSARRKLGLSLTELADASGISHSTISRIENNKISPNWSKVVTLCAALKVQIGDLFESQTDPAGSHLEDAVVTRSSKAPSVRFGGTGYELHYGHNKARPFNFIVMTHENSTLEGTGGLQGHEGYEFTYVISGTLKVLMESKEAVNLEAGDSIQFSSSIPHAYLRVSDEPVRTLMLLCGEQEDPVALLSRLTDQESGNR